MTSTRAPIDHYADTELHRRIHAESPYWDMMYQAMLGQLANYIHLAVAEALAAHGIGSQYGHNPAPAQAETRGNGRSSNHQRNAGDQRTASGQSGTAASAVPPRLQPFKLPEQVRFTRTPDALLRNGRSVPQEQPAERIDFAEAEPAEPIALFESDLPSWRKPFTLPPNVRINRTPERRPVEPDHSGKPDDTDVRDEAVANVVEHATETLSSPADEVPASVGEALEAAQEDARVPAWFGMIHPETRDQLQHVAEQDNGHPRLEALEPSDDAHLDDLIAEAWLSSQGEPESAGPVVEPEACESEPDQHLELDAIDQAELEPEVPAVVPIETVTPRFAARIAKLDRISAKRSNEVPTVAPLDVVAPTASASAALSIGPLPEGPIGIASPEDARAFVGPPRAGTRRNGAPPRGLSPFEQVSRVIADPEFWEDPPLELLIDPPPAAEAEELSSGALEQNARLLEGVLEEFGIRGEIIDVRPGPVVTLYELEPAPGTKSSRVIGLSDDIARSMSAVSARVAVVQGRNVIGIELPNQRRETVFLRALLGTDDFGGSKHKLAIALGKTIGGEPIIVDLARMPHLLVAGTTGSGKSVAINTMILSLLYRLRPDQCRLIMIDPKMLELSVYEGIPHLLTPVVTDPKKAVVALKWAVREMEDRYKKMSKVGVRNIDGFNARVAEAAAKGETITRTVQTGFNRETGESIFETEEMELSPLPYIVVIVDEMADLMMVAGKDIEGAIQRLAQMARAAGIHLIMATQRPSVDVITGTIKANFPTRISFQVTSKIDSRTILGEQGAEQLLGQGDMLYMVGGGRISRVHGPFVSDGEVEKVVAHLKLQGHPDYLDVVVAEDEAGEQKPETPDDKPVFERGAMGEEDNDLYEQAVKVVLRDKKCSTSYIQRRLQVGYNKAASLVERMEKEGLVGQANNAGKREILVYSRDLRFTESRDGED